MPEAVAVVEEPQVAGDQRRDAIAGQRRADGGADCAVDAADAAVAIDACQRALRPQSDQVRIADRHTIAQLQHAAGRERLHDLPASLEFPKGRGLQESGDGCGGLLLKAEPAGRVACGRVVSAQLVDELLEELGWFSRQHMRQVLVGVRNRAGWLDAPVGQRLRAAQKLFDGLGRHRAAEADDQIRLHVSQDSLVFRDQQRISMT